MGARSFFGNFSWELKIGSEDVLQTATVITRIDLLHPAHLRDRRDGDWQVSQADIATNYFRQHQRHWAAYTDASFADIIDLTKDLLRGGVRNRITGQFLQNNVDRILVPFPVTPLAGLFEYDFFHTRLRATNWGIAPD